MLGALRLDLRGPIQRLSQRGLFDLGGFLSFCGLTRFLFFDHLSSFGAMSAR